MRFNKQSFWSLISSPEIKSITIPIIQRAYTQGGRGGDEVVRSKGQRFVTRLVAALRGEPLLLDFIYGSLSGGVMSPLDGQQRLTTLWLLARYAAELSSAEKKSAILPLLSRFSYVERPCADQFCRALTTQAMGWQPDIDPAESIPAQPWFQQEWKLDTTVESMLRMLSAVSATMSCTSLERSRPIIRRLSVISIDYEGGSGRSGSSRRTVSPITRSASPMPYVR